MSAAVQQTRPTQSTKWPSTALAFLRHHPTLGYFLMAFGLTWLWQVPMLGLVHRMILGPWIILSPALAGLLMAGITEGRAGVGHLLRRCVLWRAGVQWYLIALLCLPAVYVLAIAVMPRGIAEFRVPGFTGLLAYLSAVAFILIQAPLSEEVGWRGFALPRLQSCHGPLLGTLILGALHALWHLPSWLFAGGNAGGTPGGLGETAALFPGWAAMIVASAFIYTWVLNHSRGSVLLAMLLHASVNASYLTVPSAFFPRLFPPEDLGKTPISLSIEIGLVIVAVLIVVLTRGRLGYDQYCSDTALATPASDTRPTPVSAVAS